MNIREAIGKLVNREDLSEAETIDVMDQIMTGEATPLQVAAFLTALRMKGETVQEITGAARVMREKVHRVGVKANRVLDTCGTGGDQKGTFNISTTSAFVVAGAGVTVAKHGNRSVSSQSGSADVLAALGVKIDASKEKVEECLEKIGIGFLFAPLLHEAMKYAVQPRRDIGIRTIFNLLGPLTNPAGATHQLTGIYDGGLTELIAQVLRNLGTVRAMVVHGLEGLDEISLSGPTKVSELKEGQVRTYTLTPEELGLERCRLEELLGGSPEHCAHALRGVLGGEKGPKRDVVLLNAGAALYVARAADSLAEGMHLAAQSIDSGKAREKLEFLIQTTNSG
ncbi:MAG TPA: anthranilate phosphoribosyltransferase [Candidatus Binatia bacterium]|jgi:anthranilate phosphoribosyltransferase|nr:anthranilate phosphoribosyltransferase [Candidatus Binatia bacterium]